jgi:hypothetical protein
VAWAVWCALALYPAVRHWALRALAVAYPVMTTLVVVATGNHFFLDAVAGTLLGCLTWVVVSRLARRSGRQGTEQGPHSGDQDGDAEAERGVLVAGRGAFGHGLGVDRGVRVDRDERMAG